LETKNINNWLLRFCFFFFILTPITELSQEKKLISFELEDQFDREYTEKSWQDSILIFVGSDQGGSEYNPIWTKAIYDTLQKELPELPVRQVGIADLNSVPFFLTGIVRGMFPDDTTRWALMDWDGIFSES